jgi:hypothetical protein
MTAPASPTSRAAAENLLHDKETIARAVTVTLYDEHPELIERHGERGRQKTLQDMHHNIDHLVPAVDLELPSMFADYVRWLDDMLRSRGVLTIYTRRCLELLIDEARARYRPDEADAIVRVIDAGLAIVRENA